MNFIFMVERMSIYMSYIVGKSIIEINYIPWKFKGKIVQSNLCYKLKKKTFLENDTTA